MAGHYTRFRGKVKRFFLVIYKLFLLFCKYITIKDLRFFWPQRFFINHEGHEEHEGESSFEFLGLGFELVEFNCFFFFRH